MDIDWWKSDIQHKELAQGGRYSPQAETAHLIPGRIRPGDVYVPVGDDGMAVAYDVTVGSPVVESSLSSSARSIGSRRLLHNVGKQSTTRTTALVGGYSLLR
jgi:hypothetical protein